MAHKPLYTFSILNNRLLQYRYNTSTQIARLHSFSNTQSKTNTHFSYPISLYKNLLTCANQDGSIVVVNIYNRKKILLNSYIENINHLIFLNKQLLVSRDIQGVFQIHNLKTFNTKEIKSSSVLSVLNSSQNIDLETLSSSVLLPLIGSDSLDTAFRLIDENPMFIDTLEHKNLEGFYKVAFSGAKEALRRGDINRANTLLAPYKNVSSKKSDVNSLFLDFKHYERFKLHIKEKKVAIAYAMCSKHTHLKLTPEYKKIQSSYKEAFTLAKEQIILGQKDLARETLSQYITILSKREEIKELLNNTYIYEDIAKEKSSSDIYNEKLLQAYEKNNFRECYELIDKYSIDELELVDFLEKHWEKLMLICEEYALDGNIKAIKTTLDELIETKTRVDKIGDLLRVAFHSKIKTLQKEREFNSAENIIYSYIDIFGVDIEIKDIMKEFEDKSLKKLAIIHNRDEKVLRDGWLNAAAIVEY